MQPSIQNRAQIMATMLAAGCVLLMMAGCERAKEETAKSEPRVEDMSRGPIEVTITVDPPRVHLDRDILLTVRITAPPDVDVALPALDDRLQGFTLSGIIDEEPVTRSGKVSRERRARLTPVLAAEYRLAPMAIAYTDHRRSPADTGWFPTRPLLFDPVPPIASKAGKDIDAVLSPVWIYPSGKIVMFYVVLVLALVGLGFLAWKLFRKVRHTIRLMRMSPRERALHDLAELLAKDLIGKNLVKDFYLELTLIVRQYIERAHAIRAPEQTTEEFLVAVSNDTRFKPEIIRRLTAFLQAADLVKFAAYHPTPDAIGSATGTAREYVETDAEAEDRSQRSEVRGQNSEMEKR